MALNLTKTVFSYLQGQPGQKFTAREIAIWITEAFPDACQDKLQRSTALHTDAALLEQLVAEIGSRRPQLQKSHPQVKTTEGRPRRYYYSEQSEQQEILAAEVEAGDQLTEGKHSFNEHDLYPLLEQYLETEFSLYSRRIDEKRSSNRHGAGGNKWLYPDLVAMEALGTNWHPEIAQCVAQYGDKRAKLWSFEVKKLLNRSNVRECFFRRYLIPLGPTSATWSPPKLKAVRRWKSWEFYLPLMVLG